MVVVYMAHEGQRWPQYLSFNKLAASSSAATQLVRSGAVKVMGPGQSLDEARTIKDINDPLPNENDILKVGKRTWAEVKKK